MAARVSWPGFGGDPPGVPGAANDWLLPLCRVVDSVAVLLAIVGWVVAVVPELCCSLDAFRLFCAGAGALLVAWEVLACGLLVIAGVDRPAPLGAVAACRRALAALTFSAL